MCINLLINHLNRLLRYSVNVITMIYCRIVAIAIVGSQSSFDITDNNSPFICHLLFIEANLAKRQSAVMQFTADDHFRYIFPVICFICRSVTDVALEIMGSINHENSPSKFSVMAKLFVLLDISRYSENNYNIF